MRQFPLYLLLCFAAVCFAPAAAAENPPAEQELIIGYVGSLTGFAASYGQAVLEGAVLAAEEVNAELNEALGTTARADSNARVVGRANEHADIRRVRIVAEDDESSARRTVDGYMKLAGTAGMSVLIGGTWWANAIAAQTAQHQLPPGRAAPGAKIPFFSCETLLNKETVRASNYFLLAGDLRDWIAVFEPLVKQKRLRRAAMIRFTSGFADTLEEALRELFSKENREFAGSVTYSDVQGGDASLLAIQIKRLAPDVVYIDGQPNILANVLRKFSALNISKPVIFTNAIAADMLKQQLLAPEEIGELYFTSRETYAPAFISRFRARYNRQPEFNADLGYYAVKLAFASASMSNPVAAVRSTRWDLDGVQVMLDEDNVFRGVRQVLWTIRNGKAQLL